MIVSYFCPPDDVQKKILIVFEWRHMASGRTCGQFLLIISPTFFG